MALSLRNDFLIGGISSLASTTGFTVSMTGAATAAFAVLLFLLLVVFFLAVVPLLAAFRTGFFLTWASTVSAVKANTVSNKHNFMIRFFICSLFKFIT